MPTSCGDTRSQNRRGDTLTIHLAGNFPRLGLCSKHSLAHWLNVDLDLLESLAANADSLYTPRLEPKKSGGTRRIDPPRRQLKAVQRFINQRLLQDLVTSPIAFGGVPHRSHLGAVGLHQRRDFLGRIDIKDFFGNITHRHVAALFRAMGCEGDALYLLTRLTTFQGRLPQGAPTSTTIANLLLSGFDAELNAEAQRLGVTVSRVVDDMHASGQSAAVRSIIELAFRRLHGLGMPVHRDEKKLRLAPRSRGHSLHNLNVDNKVSVPKDKRAELRSKVRRAARYGITVAGRRSLRGQLFGYKRIHPEWVAELIETLDQAPLKGWEELVAGVQRALGRGATPHGLRSMHSELSEFRRTRPDEASALEEQLATASVRSRPRRAVALVSPPA